MDKKAYLEIRSRLDFSKPERYWMRHVGQDICLLAITACLLCSRTWFGLVAAQFPLAAFYFRAFSMMHDAVHSSLSSDRGRNDWLGVIYGGICFLPFTTWRSIHLEHHAWAGNFERDPAMKMVRAFAGKSAAPAVETWVWRSWIPYIAFLQETVFWTVSAGLIFESRYRAGKRGELLLSVAAPALMLAVLLGAGALYGNAWALLPSIPIYLVLVEVINFPHHLRLPRLPGRGSLALWNQYKVSRTCIYSAWFSDLVLLNFNYHAEHHMFPTLPWHQLPRAHRLVREALREEYRCGMGHEWIRENRQRDLATVFAPTAAVEPDYDDSREARPEAA